MSVRLFHVSRIMAFASACILVPQSVTLGGNHRSLFRCKAVPTEAACAATGDACAPAADACAPVTEGCVSSGSTIIPADAGLSFELNLQMTEQIQLLTAQVSSLGDAAKSAAEEKEKMVAQIAELTAAKDQALAEKKQIADELAKVKARSKATDEQLVSVVAANKDLQQKLDASVSEAKKASEELAASKAAQGKSESERNKAIDELLRMQASRSEDSDTPAKDDASSDDLEAADKNPNADQKPGDAAPSTRSLSTLQD